MLALTTLAYCTRAVLDYVGIRRPQHELPELSMFERQIWVTELSPNIRKLKNI